MSTFEVGKWYRNGIRRRLEIVGIDTVCVGTEEVEVIAYRYEGKESVHMRSAVMAENWRLDVPVEVGDQVQHQRVVAGVRAGSAEPKYVTYVSDFLVCVLVHSFDMRVIAERAYRVEDFHKEYEVVPR